MTFSSSNLWCERMSAIELFAEAQHLPDSTIFFVEILGVNGHDEDEDLELCWKSVKTEVEGVICQLSDSNTSDIEEEDELHVTLAPLIFELVTDKGIFFASSKGVLACSQAFRSGNWVHGDFDVQVIYKLLKKLMSGADPDEPCQQQHATLIPTVLLGGFSHGHDSWRCHSCPDSTQEGDDELVECENLYFRGLLRGLLQARIQYPALLQVQTGLGKIFKASGEAMGRSKQRSQAVHHQ